MSKKQTVKPLDKHILKREDRNSNNLYSSKRVGGVLLIVVLLAVSLYFLPVLQGKILASHDTDQYSAMYQEIRSHQEQGESILWTTRIFSGMPATLIGIPTYNLFSMIWAQINKVIPTPLAEFLLMSFATFFVFRVLGFNYLICFTAAIFIGFGSANFISVSAGHITKVRALSMVPVLIGSCWIALNDRRNLGAIIFTFALAFQICCNHIQITYYTLMILAILFIALFFMALRVKKLKNFVYGVLLLTAGTVLAVGVNSSLLFNTYDYSKESIRGKRILPEQGQEGDTQPASQSGDQGVGIAYATNWSLGIGETMTFLIPNFYGGGSSGALDENSNTYKALTSKGVQPAQAAGFVSQLPLYWGAQPFVAGPIYFGAVVILLFVLGLLLVKGKYKWWILAATLLTILISFGKNALWFYQVIYDVLPMFNKFRSPTMILALTQMLMAGLGVLALAVMLKKETDKIAIQKALKIGGGIVLGICLLMAVLGGSLFSFSNDYKEDPAGQSQDQRFVEQLKSSVGDEAFANEIYSAIKKDRKAMMSKDAIRSAIFIALAITFLYLAAMGKLPMQLAVLGVAFIALADLWGVNKRYLGDTNFSDKELHAATLYQATPADQVIQQYGANARMLDVTVNMFNDAAPSYFHQNVGGYHPAKLRRYQDLIERGISPDLASLNTSGLNNIPVLNMLNMRFLKTGPEVQNVVQNPNAFGNCWLVDSAIVVQTDLEEIEGLHKYDLRRNAIVHKEFESMLSGFSPAASPGDTIYLKKFETDRVEYEYQLAAPRVAVFSEIIYKPNIDWTSAIDGKDHPHFRANYALRAMLLPAGKHTVTFSYMPKVFAMTKIVSQTASGIFILLISLTIFYMTMKVRQKQNNVNGKS